MIEEAIKLNIEITFACKRFLMCYSNCELKVKGWTKGGMFFPREAITLLIKDMTRLKPLVHNHAVIELMDTIIIKAPVWYSSQASLIKFKELKRLVESIKAAPYYSEAEAEYISKAV